MVWIRLTNPIFVCVCEGSQNFGSGAPHTPNHSYWTQQVEANKYISHTRVRNPSPPKCHGSRPHFWGGYCYHCPPLPLGAPRCRTLPQHWPLEQNGAMDWISKGGIWTLLKLMMLWSWFGALPENTKGNIITFRYYHTSHASIFINSSTVLAVSLQSHQTTTLNQL